ncbi:hypothetical protein PHYPSEUDO_006057 [Phytophthora pseudosyringae]|uniref:Ankyrin repeat-containing domain n=1 Tax=Phytophthora pseudosyringae TaxID=221518 RepID=A0A8T1VMK4_9STRA|nr:hypothetical protein PHYPSEUDO_006057 [Phytophthora pseudosyringae]
MKRYHPSDDAHPYKRLRHAQFPREVRALPHILKRIDLFALWPEEAVHEAAATGQLEWLQKLLPRIEEDKDDVACNAINTAAAHGHGAIVKFAYKWWKESVPHSLNDCNRALMKAVDGGHEDAVKCLLEPLYTSDPRSSKGHRNIYCRYLFDIGEALSLAEKKGMHNIVEVICQNVLEREDTYGWAAQNGNLEAFTTIMRHHGGVEAQYKPMLLAIRHGHLDIVTLVFEKCGAEILNHGRGELCPLVAAMKRSTQQVVDYLYSWFADYAPAGFSYGPAICAAAESGLCEVVKLMYDEQTIGNSTLQKAFVGAAGKGHVGILEFLQSEEHFENELIDQAFVAASGGNQLHAVKYLCGITGYQTTSMSFDNGFVDAASGGYLEIVRFLDSVGRVSPRAVTKAFKCAAQDTGPRQKVRGKQAEVLAYLYDKECISSAFIRDMLVEAAGRSCIDVVKFLYTHAPISNDLIDDAFQNAVNFNCKEVVEFLYKTGAVDDESVTEAFLVATDMNDLYLADSLFSCGCISETLLEDAYSEDNYGRVGRYLKLKRKALQE